MQLNVNVHVIASRGALTMEIVHRAPNVLNADGPVGSHDIRYELELKQHATGRVRLHGQRADLGLAPRTRRAVGHADNSHYIIDYILHNHYKYDYRYVPRYYMIVL